VRRGTVVWGSWTDEKLERLRKYLMAYRRIFDSNPKALKLKTMYVDAFAGTGGRKSPARALTEGQIGLPTLGNNEESALAEGSARVALQLPRPFNEYIFIEKDGAKARILENLKEVYPERAAAIRILCGDANQIIPGLVGETDWRMRRAVVFLDPFGMQVEWSTIEALGRTKAVDLWLLFPLSTVLRMLPRRKLPSEAWQKKLRLVLGTAEWNENFYRAGNQTRLFDKETESIRNASLASVAKFVQSRLETCFAGVAENYGVLRNSKGSAMYLLCFAASNPTGKSTALRIANDILRD
jgi:three-Cys-motif partner protein